MHEVIKAGRESQRPADILLLWGIFPLSWFTVLTPGIILQFRGQRDDHTLTAHRVDVIRLLGWEYASDRPAPLCLQGLAYQSAGRPMFCNQFLSDQCFMSMAHS
jgi:hypothetical protein